MKRSITQSRQIRFAAAFRCTLPVLVLVAGIAVAQGQQPPDALTITKEGNVGVGTTEPRAKIDVAGSGWFRSDQGALPSTAGKGVRVYYDSALGIGEIFAQDYSTFPSKPNNLILQHFGGHVGIGTATPTSRLSIIDEANTAAGQQIRIGSIAGTNDYTFGRNPTTGYLNFSGSQSGFVGYTFSGGNVGVGTTRPLSGLSISSVKSQANSPNQEIGQLTFVGFDRNVASASILAQSPSWDDQSHLIFKTSNSGAGAQERMRITSDGNVGIGTTNPTRGKLEIIGSLTTSFSQIGYLTSFPVDTDVNNPTVRNGTVKVPVGLVPSDTGPVSLYADNSIAAASFWAFSDARIKHVEGRSVAARDLATLQRIEVTDYTYIDSLSKGSGTQKKIIGQQVEKVFPQAVIRTRDIVPDIYQKATVKDGWVMLATNLKKGERVRLIGKKEEGVHEVLEVAEGRFRTTFAADGDLVFVYGREVNDARRVDYEAISMLNVSATQELARRLEKLEAREAQVASREQKDAEVKALQDENAALRSRVAEQEKRLAAIETLLVSGDKPAVRTASLRKVD